MKLLVYYALFFLYPPLALLALAYSAGTFQGDIILGQDIFIYSLILILVFALFFVLSQSLAWLRKQASFKAISIFTFLFYLLFFLWLPPLSQAYPLWRQVTPSQILIVAGFYLGQIILSYQKR